MEIPSDIPVIETRCASTWLQGGIIYSVGKANLSQQKEDALENLAVIQRLTKGNPTPQICDISKVRFVSAEAKQVYGGVEYESLVSAMALLVDSTYSKVNANYMTQVVKPAYPSETFSSLADAEAWVKSLS